jgi:V/A-type H+/Na+-transporting ATPase subunit C
LSSPVATYGFINAKLRTRLSKLLDERTLEKLRQAPSLSEAVQLLKQTAYSPEAGVYESTGDVKEVEAALWRKEIGTIADLGRYLAGVNAAFLKALMLRYEIDIVRNCVRLWFDAHMKRRSIGGESGYLYQETLVHPFSIDQAVNAEDFDRLTAAFDQTPYRSILRENRHDIEKETHLFHFETDLDLFFYVRLLEAAENLKKRDREIALRLIAVEIDLRNVDRIARLAFFYPPEEREKWHIIIPGGTFPRALLNQAVAVRKGEDAVGRLLSGRYAGFESPSPSSADGRLAMVEGVLRQIRRDETMRLLKGNPFTIGIVLAYIFLKRKEIGAVVSLLNAHYYGTAPGLTLEAL